MITVLKATEQQKKDLEGNYNNGNIIRFIQDADGNWIIGEDVLTDPNFAEVHDQLNELGKIEYKPKKINI
jgi:hypothetical protein